MLKLVGCGEFTFYKSGYAVRGRGCLLGGEEVTLTVSSVWREMWCVTESA